MGMEPSNQRLEDEKNVLPPYKKRRLERQLRAENILEQGFKPNGGPWLRSDTKHRQTAPIFLLPPEILHNIFSRLTIKDRRSSAQVCKLWWSIIRCSISNRCLTIRRKGPGSVYVHFLRVSPLLKEVKIFRRGDLSVFLRTLKYNNPLLEVLKIVGKRLKIDWLRPLDDYHFANLRVLTLKSITINLDGAANVFSRLKNLKQLEIHECDSDGSIMDVLSSSDIQLEEFVYEKSTYRPFAWVTEKTLEAFFAKMGPTLRSFKLGIPDVPFRIPRISENCVVLNFFHLRIAWTCVDESWLQQLGALRHLQHLNLYKIDKISPAVWCNLLSQPHLTGQLKTLGLCYSRLLDDSVFQTIGDKLKNLESASLHCSDIGKSALQHVIKNCSQLKTLKLSEISSRVILPSLPLIPEYLPNLRVLTYRPTFSAESHLLHREQLKIAMPNLKINYAFTCADYLR
ncbi:unnamed protein product [Bemisia tabaci]|uniref:F-box domain-containing protein n=1 Tax=Bemisia tabaci TaxID=7038 RepID=A0A9P0AAJ5_BEMTA|nr:unnamed protein product [Bemisia tabaci]